MVPAWQPTPPGWAGAEVSIGTATVAAAEVAAAVACRRVLCCSSATPLSLPLGPPPCRPPPALIAGQTPSVSELACAVEALCASSRTIGAPRIVRLQSRGSAPSGAASGAASGSLLEGLDSSISERRRSPTHSVHRLSSASPIVIPKWATSLSTSTESTVGLSADLREAREAEQARDPQLKRPLERIPSSGASDKSAPESPSSPPPPNPFCGSPALTAAALAARAAAQTEQPGLKVSTPPLTTTPHPPSRPATPRSLLRVSGESGKSAGRRGGGTCTSTSTSTSASTSATGQSPEAPEPSTPAPATLGPSAAGPPPPPPPSLLLSPPACSTPVASRQLQPTWSATGPEDSQRMRSSALDGEARLRRQSNGLVFNPGSATVEYLGSCATTCRLSISPGVVSEPQLPIVAEEPCGEVPHLLAPSTEESISELFARFVSAERADLACHLFERMMMRCDVAGSTTNPGEPPHQRIQRLCGSSLPWRARSVWEMLRKRARRPEYATAPLRTNQAVVCGAGPCGLRAALELALLGADVTVVEKRLASEASGRINRLHLWEWCKLDLLAWGAKLFDPPGGAFGGDNDFCHIGIGELQLLLLKNSLLLGVKFLFNTEATDVKARTLLCSSGRRVPCDTLVIASGVNSVLSQALGLRSVALGLRGRGSAIGVVANFDNDRDQQQTLRQFSWARQFNTPLFTRLEDHTAINLENVVYYKAQSHHYMVMTPTKRSLLDAGVLREEVDSGQLLRGSNVDVQKLGGMVKDVAAFFGLPTELCSSQGAMIFDFSGIRRLESPATMLEGTFICAVGDALLEPFWPEGLGIIRGFMSVLDAASAVVMASQGKHEEAVAQMAATYNILKSVAAQTASQCLQKDPQQYRLQPKSRYIFSH